MFKSTEMVVSRENFLKEFIERYHQERNIKDYHSHKGPWLFTFAFETRGEKIIQIKPLSSAGVFPDAFRNIVFIL